MADVLDWFEADGVESAPTSVGVGDVKEVFKFAGLSKFYEPSHGSNGVSFSGVDEKGCTPGKVVDAVAQGRDGVSALKRGGVHQQVSESVCQLELDREGLALQGDRQEMSRGLLAPLGDGGGIEF
jgi:hypothetical protein